MQVTDKIFSHLDRIQEYIDQVKSVMLGYFNQLLFSCFHEQNEQE